MTRLASISFDGFFGIPKVSEFWSLVSSLPKVTQTSIARDLSLSQALVSKVLNGGRDRVDPGTYDKVWAYALKVGYTAKGMNLRASAEATSIRQVGIVFQPGVRLFAQGNLFSHVQEGLHSALAKKGYSTVIFGSEDTVNPEEIPPLPGLVVLGHVKLPFVRKLARRAHRVVSINDSYPGICNSVAMNEAQSVELAVAHLADLGHRQLGWMGGTPPSGKLELLHAAFVEAIGNRGLPIPKPNHTITIETGAERQEGWDAAAILMASSPLAEWPTAIVVSNGLMARGAINCLLQNGIRVPKDISIAAVDATRVCVEQQPHITSAGTVPERLGEAAARLILNEDVNPEAAHHDLVLGAHLFLGTTTDKPGR